MLSILLDGAEVVFLFALSSAFFLSASAFLLAASAFAFAASALAVDDPLMLLAASYTSAPAVPTPTTFEHTGLGRYKFGANFLV